MSKDDANHYIETHRGDRPWLNSARNTRPEIQRVFAALDQGTGHAHIRHEGWLTPDKSQLRVEYMQDPAQLDPVKQAEGKDGLHPDEKDHYCGAVSSTIRDPAVFAAVFARAIEHPDLRQALETPLDEDHDPPQPLGLPITELLGPEGHRHCEGYQLIGDSWKQAVRDRKTWLHETRSGMTPSVPHPVLAPVDFRGGTIEFRFKANEAETGYEVNTMFPDPPREKPDHK